MEALPFSPPLSRSTAGGEMQGQSTTQNLPFQQESPKVKGGQTALANASTVSQPPVITGSPAT